MSISLKYIPDFSFVELFVFWRVGLPGRTKQVMVTGYVVGGGALEVRRPVNTEILVHFSLKNSNRRLLNGEVSHLNIQAMVVDSLEALRHSSCESWFTDPTQHVVVWNGASLVELPKKVVEVNYRSGVDHELVPVGALWHKRQALSIVQDMLEVPRELKNVSVLSFVERDIGSDSFIQGFDGGLLVLLLTFSGLDCLREGTSCNEGTSSDS